MLGSSSEHLAAYIACTHQLANFLHPVLEQSQIALSTKLLLQPTGMGLSSQELRSVMWLALCPEIA